MDQQNDRKEHHGNFFNAFVLGVVVGIAVALLLTTKKGRRILRTLTDEGMKKMGGFENIVKQTVPVVPQEPEDVDEMMAGQDFEAAEELKKEPVPSHVSTEAVKHSLKHEEHTNGTAKSSTRRFFRGAKRG